MKTPRFFLAFLSLLFIISSCDPCDDTFDPGIPEQKVRLLSQDGLDLWFGVNALYNPDSAVFEHSFYGELPFTVLAQQRYIAIKFPELQSGESEGLIYLKVKSRMINDRITYRSISHRKDCVMNYEMSIVKFNGTVSCTECNISTSNPGELIELIKDL